MPLTTKQRDHLERRLREERDRVQGLISRYSRDLGTSEQDSDGDLTKMPLHPADEGTDTFDQELDAQETTRLSAELDEIDDALERLASDPENFGRDQTTGQEIPFERLDVIPWARRGVGA
jgi:RNA polymerase-binding transcription factor